MVFPFWEEEEEEEEEDLALHDFERLRDFIVDDFFLSPLEKEQRSVFTAFTDDDISFKAKQVVWGNIFNFWG